MTLDTHLVWTAGLLEGEGSFLTKTGGRAPIISCHMTDLDVLERLSSILGGAIYSTRKQAEHHKVSWRWQLTGDRAAKAMRDLLPHMGLRRAVAITQALKTWDGRTPYVNPVAAPSKTAALYYLEHPDVSLRQVGKMFGVNYETVRNYVKKIDIPW